MGNYSGKDWEYDFRISFKGTKYSNGLLRLVDSMSGFSGQNNPFDFLEYSYPNLFCFELKSTLGKRLDFAKIRQNQIEGLSKWGEGKGVIAGVLVNFYEFGNIYFIPIEVINIFKANGKKSINIDMCEQYCYRVDGSKRRTRYRINVLKTLEDLRTFEHPYVDFTPEED